MFISTAHRYGFVWVLLLAIFTYSHATFAGKRVALVVGNGDYTSLNDLANPKADAKAVAKRLTSMGFTIIGRRAEDDGQALYNLDQSSFYAALDRFANKAKNAEIAMIYYAGHGMQIEGQPFLLPSDVIAPKKKYQLNLLKKASIGLDEVLAMVDAKADLTVAVFDACREIPDIEKLTRSSGLSSAGYRGLGRVSSHGKNRIIAYSGGSGELVADGSTGNSPYTSILLNHLNQAKLDVPQVFQTVAYEFSQQHDGQNPELLIQGVPPNKYYLVAGNSIQATPVPLPNPVKQQASLTINTTPTGATVFLNGGYLGLSPQTVKGLNTRKAYNLEARLQGYDSVTESVRLQSGKRSKVNLVLTSPGTHLTVATTPNNARVRILNITPPYQAGIKLTPGSYHLEVTAEGYQQKTLWVTGSGGNHHEAITLEKEPNRQSEFGFEWATIPEGIYLRGSNDGASDEQPVKRVSIASFKLLKYEVTQKQWQAVMGDNPSSFKDCGENCPVEKVSWDDIQTFIQKLNQRTGQYYRLPSEAEWEYAAKAGGNTKYSWGNSISCNKAQYNGGEGSACYYKDSNDNYRGTARVGSFSPNDFGLYDMHGNVFEWTQDCWNDSYDGAPTTNKAWESGECAKRVLRGGSWFDDPGNLRSADRFWYSASSRSGNGGFRLVQGR
jgi:formylglycine-generating enzyme required for sulfatase activity